MLDDVAVVVVVQTWRKCRIVAELRLPKVVKQFELEGEFGVLVVFELWKAAQFY